MNLEFVEAKAIDVKDHIVIAEDAEGASNAESFHLWMALIKAVMFVGYCILYGINKGE